MQTTAQAEHIEIIGRLTAATTVEEMTTALAAITTTEAGRGWDDDRAPGTYFNGHLFATVSADGSRAYTDLHTLPNETFTLWQQATMERTTRERGRPEIGRAIQVRLPEKTLRHLDWYAAREGISRSAAIRDLISMGIIADARAANIAQAIETGFPAGTIRII